MRYFHQMGYRHWVFAATTGESYPNGKPELAALRKASDTRIVRHRKLKTLANPYDPQWEMYFEQRDSLKMQDSLRGKTKTMKIWLDQERICPICEKMLITENDWCLHYITRKVDGGKDQSTNLVMVHRNCHRKIHTQNLKVVKPARESGL